MFKRCSLANKYEWSNIPDAVSTQTVNQLIKCSQKGASRQTAQLDLGTGLSNKKQFIFYFATFENFEKCFDVGLLV